MTIKSWLLQKLLIPAGILPPAVKYEDLQFNENLRQKIENVGFEYFYMLEQDPIKIINSPIGKKIFALHAPWPEFSHNSLGNPLLRKVANFIVFKGKKIPRDFSLMAQKSFEFAKKVGAKVVTVHIYFFNHNQLAKELAILADLEEKFKIKAAIEHDGPYIPNLAQKNYFLKVDNSYLWMIHPSKMIKVLDEIYPQKKFGICLDTASLIGQELPIIPNVKKIFNRINHVHLASSIVGKDVAGEIDRREIVDVVQILYQGKYSGYITAEVNGALGEEEERIARIYGGSSVLGFPLFKDLAVKNAQRHIFNSCQYLFNNLTYV